MAVWGRDWKRDAGGAPVGAVRCGRGHVKDVDRKAAVAR